MPKMRTHSGTKKRISFTASGKVKRGRPGTSHLAPGKTQKRIRHLRKSALISKSDLKRLKKLLGNLR
jgi:large subunit ribosomal protein L35